MSDTAAAAEVQAEPKRWAVAGRAVWQALILLPVTAWLVLVLAATTYSAPPQRTGDPLLDKYCALITPRALAVGFDFEEGVSKSELLEDYELAKWRDEFGDDPRYWMLRYNCTPEHFLIGKSDHAYLGVQDRVYFLEEARRFRVTNGAVLLNLLREYEFAWSRDIASDDSLPALADNADPAEQLRARRLEIDSRYGSEQAQLLSELLAAAGDQALPHYYAAMYDVEHGDYQAALDELARGNGAPHNSALWGFPYDDLLERMRAGASAPDKIGGASILSSLVAWPMPDYVPLRRVTTNLIDDAVARGDTRALDEINTFVCRFGDSDGGTVLGALIGQILLQYEWKSASTSWPQPLTAEQQKALGELRQELDKLRNLLTTTIKSSTWYKNPSGIQTAAQLKPLAAAEALLGGRRNLNITTLEALYNDTYAAQQALGGPIHDLFGKIESFEYTTFSWKTP